MPEKSHRLIVDPDETPLADDLSDPDNEVIVAFADFGNTSKGQDEPFSIDNLANFAGFYYPGRKVERSCARVSIVKTK